MLEIKFALVVRRSASSVAPTPECAKLISKHNEKERRTGYENSWRAAGPSHLKRSLLKGPGRESCRQPPSKFVIWRFRVAFFWSPHTARFDGILGQRLAAVQTSARFSFKFDCRTEKFNRMPKITTRLTSILMTVRNSQISLTFINPREWTKG